MNELISIMGQSVLRKLVCSFITAIYHSLVWDNHRLNDSCKQHRTVKLIPNIGEWQLCGQWRSCWAFCPPKHYCRHYYLSNERLAQQVCLISLSLCRGQAYDGAATMQGWRKGVVTQIRDWNPAALPVHCFGHCLKLCLQDVGRQIPHLEMPSIQCGRLEDWLGTCHKGHIYLARNWLKPTQIQ